MQKCVVLLSTDEIILQWCLPVAGNVLTGVVTNATFSSSNFWLTSVF